MRGPFIGVVLLFAAAPAVAALAVQPLTLDFGGYSMATTSPSQTITVTNTGASNATVSSVASNAADFLVSHGCGTLAPSQACSVVVGFWPQVQAGVVGSSTPVSGTLTIASDQPTVTASLQGQAQKSLATHFYRAALRRAPEPGGREFWDGEALRMQGLGANVNEAWYAMAAFFYASPEYAGAGRDDTGFVTDLYRTFFDRVPDAPGLSFWLDELSAGVPRGVVLTQFLFSTEFRTVSEGIFGARTVRAEVDLVVDLYRGALGRLPDAQGFQAWVEQLRAARCVGASAVAAKVSMMAGAFFDSGEYLNRNRSNGDYVGDQYNAFLRRGGERSGVLFWVQALQGALQTRAQVRDAFLASPEFSARAQAVAALGCASQGARVQLSSGYKPKVALGTDGKPIVAFLTPGNAMLQYVHCGDSTCTQGNTTRFIAGPNLLDYDMVIGEAGYPVFLYWDQAKVLTQFGCANFDCTVGGGRSILSTFDDPRVIPTILARAGGAGLTVAYNRTFQDGTPAGFDRLQVRRCALGCSGFRDALVDGPVGDVKALELGADGVPIAFGFQFIGTTSPNTARRFVARCADAACATSSEATLTQENPDLGTSGAIATPADNKPVLFYSRYLNAQYAVQIEKCEDAACTTRSAPWTLDIGSNWDVASTALLPDGAPIIAYPGAALKVAKCADANCATASVVSIDGFGPSLREPSIAVGPGGKPMVVFSNPGYALHYLLCAKADCSP